MKKQIKVTAELKNCHTCNSDNIKYSCGAMFRSFSLFCSDCGCSGKDSDTEPKEPDIEKRKEQALLNWNAGLLKRDRWRY